jgi:hypothetical protein
MIAWWRCVKAGPSNPQQGFVCTDRAKVHLAGNYFWSSEFSNRADPNPARMGDAHYDGLSCPLAGAVSYALRNHAGKGYLGISAPVVFDRLARGLQFDKA